MNDTFADKLIQQGAILTGSAKELLNRELTACRAEAEQQKELNRLNEALQRKYVDRINAILPTEKIIANHVADKDTLRAALATAELERDQARRQTMMDTECIERIRTVGMAAEAELAAALATIAEMREALEEFRDAVLNGRHQLEAPCLDNDQTNAVLGLFDDILSRNQPTKEVMNLCARQPDMTSTALLPTSLHAETNNAQYTVNQSSCASNPPQGSDPQAAEVCPKCGSRDTVGTGAGDNHTGKDMECYSCGYEWAKSEAAEEKEQL